MAKEKLSWKFIETLPKECRVDYRQRQQCTDCPLKYEGASDPLNLVDGKAYDIMTVGGHVGTRSRVFVEYQLRASHEFIPDGRDEKGRTKYKQDVWSHIYYSIWFFKNLPGEKKKEFWVTKDSRIRGESKEQPKGQNKAVNQPKSLTSQQDPALALKRHNAAVKAHETRRRLKSGSVA
jgi:hypothetical protein